MMSLFGSRRDRHTTTSRRPRHARPQVEGLEKIIALDAAGATVAPSLHQPPVVNGSNTAEATNTQFINQTGSTVNVTLDKGKYKGATIIVEANTFNVAVQVAKIDVNATTTVNAIVDVNGHKKAAKVDVKNTANASNTQVINQSGAAVSVDLEKGDFKGATLVISADTVNKAFQEADVNANAPTTVGKKN